MASGTQQTRSGHTESSVRFDAEDQNVCENSGVATQMVLNRV